MKESITKFDLEAAFKALDEIDTPKAEKGIKANRPALTEIFSRKSKFDALFEEYYDISSTEGLDDAKEARDAEIAKAKLARIEKIVDLEAESPEDLLTSYVGKYIMQCPQCMTLFYKNKEDVVESEEDPSTVNVNEVCQHCGNESGYTLIGKVGEASSEEEPAEETEITTDELSLEEPEVEETSEETSENTDEEDFDLDSELDELDLEIEDDETDEEKKEESFSANPESNYLLEQLTEDSDLDVSADEFEDLINSSEFKKPISDTAVRAMLSTESDATDEIEESININGETLRYAVINPDGTYAGAPCTSEEEARELAAQREGRIVVELVELKKNSLTEGTGADTAKVAKDVLTACSKEDKDGFANKTSKIIEAIPEEYFDKIFDTIKDKLSDIKLDKKDKEKIIDAGGQAVDAEKVEKADTLGKVLEFLDISTWDAGALKAFVMTVLIIVGIIEPSPVVEVICVILGFVPDGVLKKILVIINQFNLPIAAGMAANKLYKAKKKNDINNAATAQPAVEEGLELKEGIFDNIFKTRAGKADWVLKNAREDYNNVQVDEKGEPVTDKNKQRFNTFVVIGYKDKYDHGAPITKAPQFNSPDLVVGMDKAMVAAEYKSADNIAKGWSMQQGNGPACIYLAKGVDDDKAVFLCEYFKGKLEYDQLDKYTKAIKDHLKGAKLMAKGGAGQQTTGADTTKAESLNNIMSQVEELKEASLEKLISDSLIEAYGNVAGFRLHNCSYLNEKFQVDGTIFFTSGNTRKTAYAFTEAFVKDSKVSLYGLNEKLGLDKQFSITGHIDNKTFITESFKYTKK
jgi:hypothetical protein